MRGAVGHSTFAPNGEFYGLPAVRTLAVCPERRVLRASRGRNTRPQLLCADGSYVTRGVGRRGPKGARGRGLGTRGDGRGAPHTRCAGPFRTFQERVPGRAIQNIPLPLATQSMNGRALRPTAPDPRVGQEGALHRKRNTSDGFYSELRRSSLGSGHFDHGSAAKRHGSDRARRRTGERTTRSRRW